MATTIADARAVGRAAERSGVQFMVAYRLHFDPATLRAIELARDRRAGELRIFASTFSSPVERGDIRLQRKGRGGLFDLGIYCVNAARMVFRSEPVEVTAMHAGQGPGRFREVPEMTAAMLRYPGERVAMFVCSLNAYRGSSWTALTTKRQVRMEPAYTYHDPLVVRLRSDTTSRTRRYGVHDQFAAELDHFVARVRSGRKAEPSAREGEADIIILDAIDRAARTGRRIRLRGIPRDANAHTAGRARPSGGGPGEDREVRKARAPSGRPRYTCTSRSVVTRPAVRRPVPPASQRQVLARESEGRRVAAEPDGIPVENQLRHEWGS